MCTAWRAAQPEGKPIDPVHSARPHLWGGGSGGWAGDGNLRRSPGCWEECRGQGGGGRQQPWLDLAAGALLQNPVGARSSAATGKKYKLIGFKNPPPLLRSHPPTNMHMYTHGALWRERDTGVPGKKYCWLFPGWLQAEPTPAPPPPPPHPKAGGAALACRKALLEWGQ